MKGGLSGLLIQFTDPDTEESCDILDQFLFRFTESVFPVTAGSAHETEDFIGRGS